MAPKQRLVRPQAPDKTVKSTPTPAYKMIINGDYVKKLFFDPAGLFPIACLLFFLEIIINAYVIERVKYTEIDWKAYMQEVEGPINGTWDYSKLRGDTGPLVYPAGFVWIFTGLYALTNRGENIRLAQYAFLFLYLVNILLVFRLYIKAKKVPPYVLVLTCLTSYRIHSIYVLRLFNDPVAMLLLFASINAFLDSRWTLGSVLYSLAVSVKMNILLFAPALLLSYIVCLGYTRTILQLSLCAVIQLILAIPFLLTNPIAYIVGSFDFGRVFLYQWTVNWRFLPEEIFLHKGFHLCLLLLHLGLLLLFFKYAKLLLENYVLFKRLQSRMHETLEKESHINMDSLSQLFLTPMFLCNLIGIACSRSLHYQFYVWYFHTLPYLAWSTNYSNTVRLIILGLIEFCWNTYPSTSLSSLALHLCHFALLWGIYKAQAEAVAQKASASK